jgi:hypothetical protein
MKIVRKSLFLPWILSLVASFVLGQKLLPTSDREAVSEVEVKNLRFSSRPPRSSDGNGAELSRSAKESLGSSMSNILRNKNVIERGQAWLTFIKQLDTEDFPGVAADLSESGFPYYRITEYRAFLVAWTRRDPIAAMTFVQGRPTSFEDDRCVLAEWTRIDPEGAIRWNQENSSESASNSRVVSIVSGLASSDPYRATEFMLQLGDEKQQKEASEVIIRALAKNGVELASSWLDDLNFGKERKDDLTVFLAGELAKVDPSGTAAWLESVTDFETRSSAIENLASRWSERDLAGAVAWVDSITGTDRTTAAVNVVENYALQDAAEAAVWMESMAGETGYEDIVTAFLNTTSESEPALSLPYVSELSGERLQYSLYYTILARWRSDDPQAAEAWINANEIPDLVRLELQKNSAR